MNGQCMVVGAGKCEEGGLYGETTCLTQAKGLGGLEFAGWEMEERLRKCPHRAGPSGEGDSAP